MTLQVHSVEFDQVIRSTFISAQADYRFALEKLVPLIGRLNIQREIQAPKFYDRLAKDIVNGCIMPPLTLAIVSENLETPLSKANAGAFITDRIDEFFVLDGMQRLNTIDRTYKRFSSDFPLERPVLLNVLICHSMDLLLYRMITLNNGQKPMTARHQIEIIASNIYDFDDKDGLAIQTEKRQPGQKRKRGAFKKADLIKSYLAFLSESVNVDNDKIIQEKMDELLASKIMNSDLTTASISFDDVLLEVGRLYDLIETRNWIMTQNNLIGFCAGARRSAEKIRSLSDPELINAIQTFEDAFSGINVSKIKLGNARRKAVKYFSENIERLSQLDSDDLLDEISQEV